MWSVVSTSSVRCGPVGSDGLGSREPWSTRLKSSLSVFSSRQGERCVTDEEGYVWYWWRRGLSRECEEVNVPSASARVRETGAQVPPRQSGAHSS